MHPASLTSSDEVHVLPTPSTRSPGNGNDKPSIEQLSVSDNTVSAGNFRLYKRRWLGVAVLVRVCGAFELCLANGSSVYARRSGFNVPALVCAHRHTRYAQFLQRSAAYDAHPESPTVREDMGYSVLQVDWLGTITACAFLVVAFQVPIYVRFLGVRKTVRILTFELLCALC